MLNEQTKNNVNDLHTELGYPLEDTTPGTGEAMEIQLINTFKHCKGFALGKAKKAKVSKMAIPHSLVEGKRLFVDISSPFTASVGDKKHSLLVVEKSLDYAWGYF